MKYRRLTKDELESLTDEFVKFMIVNGIDAKEWLRIKGDEPVKAIQMIDLFSDFIFDGIVRKVKNIDYFDEAGVKLFKCDEDVIHLISIESDKPVKKVEDWEEIIQSKSKSCTFIRTSKAYKPDRNTEIFRMIRAGGNISDGKWFETIAGGFD